jgi:CHAT domain-containing protein
MKHFGSSPLFVVVLLLGEVLAQSPDADPNALLKRGLQLADLYNWADAAPTFARAEELFAAAGDQRNALHARLGRIRANVEREQRTLHQISAQLGTELETNPLLRDDKQLRMFCLIVKGDVDTEIDTKAMRRDWEQVQTLARELNDQKWQYRALAQLGLAAFYEGDVETARKNVGTALMAAKKAGDAGAQIRYLTAHGFGLFLSKMYEQALPYFDNALKIASTVPDAGYQFPTQEARAVALMAIGKLDEAQRLIEENLAQARHAGRTSHEAGGLVLAARIARARQDRVAAFSVLDRAAALCESAGLVRTLADAQGLLADLHREGGDLAKAERFSELAAASTQASGNLWAVPQRLQAVAELQVLQGKHDDADRVYERAAAFVDSMIGNVSGVLEKTALIRASSELYTRHFSLVAERFNDPVRAYSIVEQVRGRIATDLLRAGAITSDDAAQTERALSQLRLRLIAARSNQEVRRIRDEMFMQEQARLVAPGVSILKARSHATVGLAQVQEILSPSAIVLEYVVANPRSYCLVISRSGSRIVPLEGRDRIEALVTAYLAAVKKKQSALPEARSLCDAVVGPISETTVAKTLVVVRDGQLHRVPFDALVDASGRHLIESRTVAYAPSATSFFLLSKAGGTRTAPRLLAVGGVPYNRTELSKLGLVISNGAPGASELPSSADEVRTANAAIRGGANKLLLGTAATESAFKRADLGRYPLIHLAVHGFADTAYPDRATLLLAGDPSQGEDGLLQSSEIVQLKLKAQLVVLSACDTAVGGLQGQEGVATLSRAFLLAGAKAVVSTLWSIDDVFSLSLMRRFYKHLVAGDTPVEALTTAKREMLRQLGRRAVPYYWASFTFEGAPDSALSPARRTHQEIDAPESTKPLRSSQID